MDDPKMVGCSLLIIIDFRNKPKICTKSCILSLFPHGKAIMVCYMPFIYTKHSLAEKS